MYTKSHERKAKLEWQKAVRMVTRKAFLRLGCLFSKQKANNFVGRDVAIKGDGGMKNLNSCVYERLKTSRLSNLNTAMESRTRCVHSWSNAV